jgi:AcrR family transcriptional regulator
MRYRLSRGPTKIPAPPPKQQRHASSEEPEVRTRILDAAFAAFMQSGYAASSMLEIANRARVSKRELYALVGNKQEMLITCIGARARRWRVPADLPMPRDRKALAAILSSFGATLLHEIGDPTVIAVFRLAISEAVHTPAVAQTLDSIGREATHGALRQLMTHAQTSGLLDGHPVELAEQFSGLLWGTLMVSLLLGVAERPSARDIAARAGEATAAFLRLHASASGQAPAKRSHLDAGAK